MSATITQHQQHLAQSKDVTSARKRRRRAPAGGAADDCFSCSKKNLKCDRKRPYCSPCLDVGVECSGYKTQLTWGVGVASRGKLRGLSLPIAKSPAVSGGGGGGSQRKAPQRSRSTSSAAASQWKSQDSPVKNSPLACEAGGSSPEHASSSPPPPPQAAFYGYDYLSMSHSGDSSPATLQGSWNDARFSNSLPNNEGHHFKKMGAHLAPLPIITDHRLSPPLESNSDEYLSPMSHSFSPGDDMPYVHSPGIMYDSCNSQNSPIPRSPLPIVMIDQRPPTSCPSLAYAASDQSSSYPSHMDSFEAQLSQKLLRECDNLSVPELDTYSTSCGSSTGPVWLPPDEDAASHHSDQHSSQWPSVYTRPGALHVTSELIAKMPFFMDYYKTIMAPSMVFIDGPGNPFREHILQLMVGSQSLQHAICALASCNLRMKRKLSLGQGTRELSEKLMAEKSIGDALAETAIDDQSLSEEYQHRNLAVHLLNQQLNDPSKATHDAVLATILILCHYRMAESGIAKFHTQFAGVKEILAMRRSQHVATGETSWMEAIFTYFDTISASINDREGQLGADAYDNGQEPGMLPPGAENLVGCERGLFKIISKLPRLNLLSQHRPVQPRHKSVANGFCRANTMSDMRSLQNSKARAASMKAQLQPPFSYPLGHTYKGNVMGFQNQQLLDMYNIPSERFDSNRFADTLGDDEALASALSSSLSYDDHRAVFWQEWKEVRNALQVWEFDAKRVQQTLPCDTTPAQMRDLGCLSEAFRYAALLYTERLANPNAPSSSASFQNLVSQVVYYATSLDVGSAAEKFLLWPLFAAGSECINDLQQNIVRSKCRDIMLRSGYMNNLAALEILESLWAGESEQSAKRGANGMNMTSVKIGPFNWTRYMGSLGGEVEWIMF